MFTIRNQQIEAMKIPFRKRNREKMLAQLVSGGFNTVEGENNELIILDSRGNKTRLLFNENFVPQKIVKPSGLEYEIGFDSNDQLAKLNFPENESIRFQYQDELLIAILINDGRVGLNYDKKGRITEVITQDQKGYKLSYNLSNQVESITNRANESRRYESSIKDNHIIHSYKDALGRMTKVANDHIGSTENAITFPDGTEQKSVYDKDAGALVTTLRSGAKVHTYYEDLKPAAVEWEDGNFNHYHFAGENLSAIENPSGTVRLDYDDKGRVLSEDFQGNLIQYNYDPDGNLLEMVYPSGLCIKYNYDEDGRLQTIAIDENVCTYEYSTNDTIAEIHYPNGLIQRRNEQVLGGLKTCQITDRVGTILSQQIYDYDKLHRIIRYRQFAEKDSAKNRDWQFQYDDEWRLLKSQELHTNTLEQYKYDKKGNLISDNGKAIYVGKMDEVQSHGNQKVLYDGNGNIRSYTDAKGRTVSLTFNDKNELKLARIGNETWEYWYDGLGRRVGKSNGRESWKFCWAGDKLICEESKTSEGQNFREYIYAINTVVPIAFCENGQLFWLHSDVRGAVTEVFDSTGKNVWSAGYSAFGEAFTYHGNVKQPWRLMGQYCDLETGLHYNTARYYSPHLKSFLSLDRLWFKYEASNYGYAGNDPYNKVDVDGNLPEWVVTAASIGAGIVVGAVVTAGVIAAAPALGIGAVAATAIGLVAGGFVGGIAEVVVENKLNGESVCIPCALTSGAIGGVTGIIPFGKLFGKTAKGIKSAFSKLTGKAAKEAAEKAAKETAEKVAKEAAEKAAKEGAEEVIPIALGSGKGNWGKLKSDGTLSKEYKVLNDIGADEKFQKLGGWDTPEGRDYFWDNYNKPFLDEQIEKGGKFRLFDDPDYDLLRYQGGDITKGKTFFGREMDYLRDKGYTVDYESGFLIPPSIK
jgi:RHS repeat-associated protein